MDITIDKKALEKIGLKPLEPWGYSDEDWKWKREFSVDLAAITKHSCKKLRDVLTKFTDAPGVKARIEDIDRWLQLLDGEKVKVRRIKDFDSMLKEYLKPAPKHWLYERRKDSDVYQPYYVSEISYHPPVKRDGWTSAVLSRCLARIDYTTPTPENQKRIWRTLADTAGVAIRDSEIATIVNRNPGLSGRDVKNLLKLGSMVAAVNGKELTAKIVEYVRQFKPTN